MARSCPIRFRKADDLHWLELEKDENGNEISCWSLFLMGKKRKEWGFVDFVKHSKVISIHNEKYSKEKSQWLKNIIIHGQTWKECV